MLTDHLKNVYIIDILRLCCSLHHYMSHMISCLFLFQLERHLTSDNWILHQRPNIDLFRMVEKIVQFLTQAIQDLIS